MSFLVIYSTKRLTTEQIIPQGTTRLEGPVIIRLETLHSTRATTRSCLLKATINCLFVRSNTLAVFCGGKNPNSIQMQAP